MLVEEYNELLPDKNIIQIDDLNNVQFETIYKIFEKVS